MSRRLLTTFVLCALASAVGGTAHSQYLVFNADQLGLDTDPQDSNVRLRSMGGLRFVIPDENNEINHADFGQNVAGIAADKDGWSVESTAARKRVTDDYQATRAGSGFAQREAITSEVLSAEAIYRSEAGRAIGGSFAWNAQGSEFRVGNDGRVRGPSMSALWNEPIGDLSLGAKVTRITDDEALVSTNVFGITHESDTWIVGLGAVYPWGGFDWGAQYEFYQTTINGTSRDPSGFHQDDFKWQRPQSRLRLGAMLPTGGSLEFGVNFIRDALDGAEDGQISWSDRFPSNPGGFNFDRKVPTFEEEENSTRIEARALYWLGYSPRVSAFFAQESRDVAITESANFIGSRRAGSRDGSSTEIGGGVATGLFGEQLTIGIEGEVAYSDFDVTDREGTTRNVKSRDGAGRIGLEWFAREDFALRGGVEFLSTDPDTDAAFTLQEGLSVSTGFGWVPRGGIYVVDGMFRYVDREPKEDGGSNREVDSFELGLYWRLLF